MNIKRKLAIVVLTLAVPMAVHADLTRTERTVVKRIANVEISKRGPGPTGAQGATGPRGPQGTPGQQYLPFLYAHILANGQIDPNRSLGVYPDDIFTDSNAVCFMIPGASGAQVTVDWREAGEGAPRLTPALDFGPSSCPGYFLSICTTPRVGV